MSGAAPTAEEERPGNPSVGGPRRYLRQFDVYRTVAFVGVIAQHSVLWSVTGGSDVGWSLVMVLHATRELFFFLSALVAGYSQLASPRAPISLWYHRLRPVVVPYLVWTLVYWAYSLVTAAPGAPGAGAVLVHDLRYGYYQLYFLVVLFQVYVVLPALVWLVRRTRGHHGIVFGASLVLQLAMTTVSHYFSWRTGAPHMLRSVDLTLLTARYVTCYQLFVVAGVLAADHLGDLQRQVERHSGRILAAAAAAGAAAEGCYAYGLVIGETPGHASDLFQPVAQVWFLAACAGLWALGWRWVRHSAARLSARRDRLVEWGSDASGGFYLAHVLVLQVLFSGLAATGLTAPPTWWAASLCLFTGTLAGTGALVAVGLRAPWPWRTAIMGPDRSRERRASLAYPRVVESRGAAPIATSSCHQRRAIVASCSQPTSGP